MRANVNVNVIAFRIETMAALYWLCGPTWAGCLAAVFAAGSFYSALTVRP